MNWFINKKFEADFPRADAEGMIFDFVNDYRNAIIDKKALDEVCVVLKKLVEKANESLDPMQMLHISTFNWSDSVRITIVGGMPRVSNLVDMTFVKAEKIIRYEPKLFETKKKK